MSHTRPLSMFFFLARELPCIHLHFCMRGSQPLQSSATICSQTLRRLHVTGTYPPVLRCWLNHKTYGTMMRQQFTLRFSQKAVMNKLPYQLKDSDGDIDGVDRKVKEKSIVKSVFRLSERVTLHDLRDFLEMRNAAAAWSIYESLVHQLGITNIPLDIHRDLYANLKHALDYKRSHWQFSLSRGKLRASMKTILENIEKMGIGQEDFLGSVVPIQDLQLQFYSFLMDKNVESAFAYFEEILEKGTEIDKVATYRLMELINLLAEGGEDDSKLERIRRVAVVGARKLKISPPLQADWFVLVARVLSLIKKETESACELAIRIMKDMEAMPEEEFIKRRLMSELIQLFLKNEELEAAEMLYYFMRKQGLYPTYSVYAKLINRYHREELDKKAIYVYLDLNSHDPRIRELKIYNGLLRIFANKGRVQDALKVYKLILDADLAPNIISYTEIIKAHAFAEDLEGAAKWMLFMSEHGFQPNKYAYGIMVEACSRARDLNGAVDWFSKMLENNIRPNAVVLTSLLTAISRSPKGTRPQKSVHAFELVEDARGSGVNIDVILYSNLIKMYSDAMDLEGALATYQRMLSEEVPPNAITYNILMYACAANGRPEVAEQIFTMMKDSDEFPADKYTYTIMLDVHAQQRRYDDIEILVEDFSNTEQRKKLQTQRKGSNVRAKNLVPDTVLLNCWMNAYNRAANGAKVIDIFQTQFKRFNIYPDELTLTVLINSCNYNYMPAYAMVVFNKVIEYLRKQIELKRDSTEQSDVDNFPDPNVFDVPRPLGINNINLYAYIHLLGQYGYDEDLLNILDVIRSVEIVPDRRVISSLLGFLGDMEDGWRKIQQTLDTVRIWWPEIDITNQQAEAIFRKMVPTSGALRSRSFNENQIQKEVI